MKVIFLDFDGVLISYASYKEAKVAGRRPEPTLETVAAMNHLLARTQAKIVVSSVWRLGRPPLWLQGCLDAWGIHGEIIDSTPRLTQTAVTGAGTIYDASAPRGSEIQKWIDDYDMETFKRPVEQDIESFVIIDDESDMLHLEPYLVQTDFELGFQREHARQAISTLAKSRKARKALEISAYK